MDQNTRQLHKADLLDQHNVEESARDNRGENTKDITPSARIGIEILSPTGNRTRAADLEGRDSTDHATAPDHI